MDNYRQDIDGLRGICVLAVVVYHVFPNFAPAGFLGVDIFFGISGYLICQLILRQLESSEFSLFGFFASRIRRIFPALLLVFLFCIISGNYLLPFEEFRQLNLHIATGSVFSSNLLLANELGYFDTASIRKPLLHLWSLAVEEQFYIVFPFVILFLYRIKWHIGLTLLAFGTFSYAAGIYTAQNNADGAYFFSWCRFYEILAGASLAAGMRTRAATTNMVRPSAHAELQYQAGHLLIGKNGFSSYATVWSGLGLVLIIASFYVFDRNSPVPGSSTLLPLVGLLILLLNGPQAWVNRHILSSRWLVFVGKISYPLYLWHWPVWVFISIKFHDDAWSGMSAIAASIILATLTYLYVERPVRNGRLMASKAYVLLLMMVIAGLVSLRTYETNTFRTIKNELLLDRSTLTQYQDMLNDPNYKLQWTPENKKILIYGDSQAKDLFASWKNFPSAGFSIMNSASNCSAFNYSDRDQGRFASTCSILFENLLASSELKEAEILIYTHLWRSGQEYTHGYEESLERIRKMNPKLTIYFMGPKPVLWNSYVSINAIMLDYRPPQTINDYLNSVRYDNSININYARDLAAKLSVGFIDANAIMCSNGCELHSGGEHYYFDQMHWTPAGKLAFYEKSAPYLSQLTKK